MQLLPKAPFFLLTLSLSGCFGGVPEHLDPEKQIADLRATPGHVWLSGCENRYGFFEVPEGWVADHIPAGFEPAFPSGPTGPVPKPPGSGFLAIAVYACSAGNASGEAPSPAKGVMWFTAVQPPPEHRAVGRESYFVVLGWLNARPDLANVTRSWGLHDSAADRIDVQEGVTGMAVRSARALVNAPSVDLELRVATNGMARAGSVNDRLFLVEHHPGARPTLLSALNFDYSGPSPLLAAATAEATILRNTTLFPSSQLTGVSGWISGGTMTIGRVAATIS